MEHTLRHTLRRTSYLETCHQSNSPDTQNLSQYFTKLQYAMKKLLSSLRNMEPRLQLVISFSRFQPLRYSSSIVSLHISPMFQSRSCRIPVPDCHVMFPCQGPSIFHLYPRRTSDFKRGDVAGVRFCYFFVTVLLLYCAVLYGTVLCCTVVGLSCLLAQYWSCSVCVTPLVQFPLFSAVLFVLVEFVSSLNRFTSLKSSNCRLRQ